MSFEASGAFLKFETEGLNGSLAASVRKKEEISVVIVSNLEIIVMKQVSVLSINIVAASCEWSP